MTGISNMGSPSNGYKVVYKFGKRLFMEGPAICKHNIDRCIEN